MTDVFERLKAEFPREAISWRAQSMKADGTAAMALAYIDARDVMNRLDDVCGPGGWQDRYEFHGARTVCYLAIQGPAGDWIVKADGAGDTDVEAEKGGISDAFKRAAVKWGIGRYLYDLDAPWVPCEHTDRGGKKYWKRWAVDPWSKVRATSSAPQQGRSAAGADTRTPHAPAAALSALGETFRKTMEMSKDKDELGGWMTANAEEMKSKLGEAKASHIRTLAAALYRELPAGPQKEAAE